MAKLVEIEGVGNIYAEKLKQAGVRTTDNLLRRAATPKGRRELSAAVGTSEKTILEWANQVDLMRIKGISLAYADLLEAVGVDNTSELALRDPQNLHDRMVKVNELKKLVRRVPSVDEIKGWIKQALKVPSLITH